MVAEARASVAGDAPGKSDTTDSKTRRRRINCSAAACGPIALERAGLVQGFAEGANRAPAWNSAGFSVILLPMRTRRRDTAKLAMSDVDHVAFLGHSRISTDVRRPISWGGP